MSALISFLVRSMDGIELNYENLDLGSILVIDGSSIQLCQYLFFSLVQTD